MTARADLVKQHGVDAIAYSTLQPGLEYFETSYGYIAYRSALGLRLTLGPPVCAPEDRLALANRFLEAGNGHGVFFYVADDFARLLGRGHCAGIGVDKVVPLAGARLESSKEVRGALKKAHAAGFRIERLTDVGGVRPQLEAINARYLGARALPTEMKFLNRPMEFTDDGLGRQYVLRWKENGDDAVRGYARLNPRFEGGVARGDLLDILRFGPTRLWGVFYAAVATLAAELRAEGVEELSLGYCPLYRAQTEASLPRSRALDWQIDWLGRHLAEVPYVQRLRQQKSAFPGEERQRYLVSPLRDAARPFLALLSATGVSLQALLGRNLVKSLIAPYRGAA